MVDPRSPRVLPPIYIHFFDLRRICKVGSTMVHHVGFSSVCVGPNRGGPWWWTLPGVDLQNCHATSRPITRVHPRSTQGTPPHDVSCCCPKSFRKSLYEFVRNSKRGVLLGKNGAHDRSRTCTPLLGLEPESSASANSATWAFSGQKGRQLYGW